MTHGRYNGAGQKRKWRSKGSLRLVRFRICFVLSPCIPFQTYRGSKFTYSVWVTSEIMAEARPLTDFMKSNDKYAKSRERFTENEISSLVVKDVYAGLERYNCCYCGHFCAILNKKLEELPKRSTDKSTAVAKKHMLKQRLLEGEKKRIKRKKGIETQYRMLCPGCNLFVAYRCQSDLKSAKYIYVCEDSLTQKATVLHVDGKDEVSPGLISTAFVPQSVQSGREPETVKLAVHVKTGCDKSCIRKVNDDGVFVDLQSSAEESASNAELRRLLCLVLDKVRDACMTIIIL